MASVRSAAGRYDRIARVLLCAVDPEHQGGVAEYYRALRPHFSAGIDWFIVGSRPGQRSRLSAPLRVLRDTVRFAQTLRDPAYAVVHLNPSLNARAVSRDALLLLVAKTMGRKVLVFFHGWDARFHALVWRRIPGPFRRLFSRADAVVVLSEEFRCALESLGLRKPVAVEKTVVGDEMLAMARDERPKKQNGEFRILFLSRVERYKGVYETLEAFQSLQDRHSNVSLCIAGAGSELEEVKRWVASRRIKDARVTGHLAGKEKSDAFREADVYVLPTYGEGMPISVLEAMVMGLPVVTCRTGGLKDFFLNKRMGVLLEGPSAPALAEALELLASDPEARRRMGEFNREYARNQFSPGAAVQRLEALYRGLGWQPDSDAAGAVSGSQPTYAAQGSVGLPRPVRSGGGE